MRNFLISILVLSLSACSNLQQSAGNLPQPGFGSPGVGAATGGVVGAGVGALIGSTSGNLGTGAAIGTLAGAAAGAAIGKHIQGESDTFHQTEEAQIRQQDLLSNNNQQLQSLRNRHSDDPNSRAFAPQGNRNDPFPFNHPSSARSFSFDSYRGNPQAQHLGSSSSFSAEKFSTRPTPARMASVSKPRPAPAIAPVAAHRSTPAIEPRIAPAQQPIVTEPMAAPAKMPTTPPVIAEPTAASDLPPAKGEVRKSEMNPPPSPAPLAAVVAPVAPATVVPKVAAPAVTAPVAKAVTPPTPANEENCKKAQDEVEVARNAISEADQLFYYRRALRLCPSNSQYHLEIGKVYSSLNRKEDAQFELRQATELDPSNKQAADLLSSLDGKN